MHASGAGQQIVVIDTETTGLGHVDRPPRDDAVIQVGLAWRDRDGSVRNWHRTCNPGEEYLRGGRARDALRISGITEKEVLDSPPARQVAGELVENLRFVNSHHVKEVEIRAYNRAFDEPFLAEEPWELGKFRWGPCIMLAAQSRLFGKYAKWPRLEESMNALRLEWPAPRAHHAGADSHAALLVDEAVSGRRP